MLTYDLSNWKPALHQLMPWWASIPILILLHFFELQASMGQTDGRADGRARRAMRPIDGCITTITHIIINTHTYILGLWLTGPFPGSHHLIDCCFFRMPAVVLCFPKTSWKFINNFPSNPIERKTNWPKQKHKLLRRETNNWLKLCMTRQYR